MQQKIRMQKNKMLRKKCTVQYNACLWLQVMILDTGTRELKYIIVLSVPVPVVEILEGVLTLELEGEAVGGGAGLLH